MEDNGLEGLGFSLDPISGILGAGASIFSTIQAPKLIKKEADANAKLMKLQAQNDAAKYRTLSYAAIGLGVFVISYVLIKGAVKKD